MLVERAHLFSAFLMVYTNLCPIAHRMLRGYPIVFNLIIYHEFAEMVQVQSSIHSFTGQQT